MRKCVKDDVWQQQPPINLQDQVQIEIFLPSNPLMLKVAKDSKKQEDKEDQNILISFFKTKSKMSFVWICIQENPKYMYISNIDLYNLR